MCIKDIASTVRKSTMYKSREILCFLTGEVLGEALTYQGFFRLW